MADSVREKILQKISTQMATITVANGYETDIGSSVYRSRMIGSLENVPALAITGLPDVKDDDSEYRIDMLIMPVAIVAGDAITPNTDRATNSTLIAQKQEQILADIRKCFGAITLKDAGYEATKVYYTGGVETQAEMFDNQAGVIVAATFNIHYHTISGDPYSQP